MILAADAIKLYGQQCSHRDDGLTNIALQMRAERPQENIKRAEQARNAAQVNPRT